MKKLKGQQAFDNYYERIYGERWPSLRESLLSSKKYCAYYNPFVEQEKKGEEIAEGIYESDSWNAPNFVEGLKNYYLLDYASTLPVQALDIQESDKVIDLCAAPGGKSLMMMGQSPDSLNCNDLSNDRLQRLKRIMKEYVPEQLRERIVFTKRDATLWGTFEKGIYNKTLLDAPCSSERHFIEKESEMKDWSEGRTKRLSTLQFSLLASAIDITAPGGTVVYSTCSISPLENDEVIKKALKKRAGKFEIVKPAFSVGESSEHGLQVLPDKEGHGPFYLSILRII